MSRRIVVATGAGRRKRSVLLGVRAMEDILSQGGDREPSPWPRRLGVIAALIAAAVAGVVVYVSFPRHRHALEAAPSASAAPAPSPVPAPSVVAALPGETRGIAGPALKWDVSLRLPVTGAQPAWFSPASGSSEPIGGLPVARSGYQFIRVTGGWAVLASPASAAGCGGCAGAPSTAWFLADGARSVTRVGTASLAAPSATAGSVWLTSYRPGARLSTAAGTAREVSLAGAPSGPPVRLPPGYVIDQGTDRGLLLAPVSPGPGTAVDELWNPARPRAGRWFAAVLAASPTEVAWASPCVLACRVQVLDLATGRQTAVRLAAASSAASGAFSPGGAFLALQVSSGDTGDDGALAMRLEVASAATGALTPMPGTFASSDALVGFGWPASGDSLVAEFNFMARAQLAAWRPGAARPAVTDIQPGRALDALILG